MRPKVKDPSQANQQAKVSKSGKASIPLHLVQPQQRFSMPAGCASDSAQASASLQHTAEGRCSPEASWVGLVHAAGMVP